MIQLFRRGMINRHATRLVLSHGRRGRCLSQVLVALLALLPMTACETLAAPIYKINNTNNLNLTTSWSTTSGSQSPNPSSIGSTDAAYFNEATMGGSKTVALGGDLALGGLALDYVATNSANNLTISAGNTLTLNGTTLDGGGRDGAGGGTYTNAGILLNRGAGGTMTLNCNVTVGANQTWTTSRSLTVAGNLDVGSRTLSFNVAGGTTLLSGSLIGTGTITKTGGNNFNVLGDGSNFTGAFANTSTQALAIGLTTATNALSVSSTGSGYLALYSAGTTYIRNISSVANFRADYADAGTKTAVINQLISGTISTLIAQGSRIIAITKTGSGTLTISATSNNASGAFNVNEGTLRLGSSVALGTTSGATAVASGGVLDLNGQAIGAEALTLNGAGISSAGALINSSSTAASLTGAVTLGSNSSIGGIGNITLSGTVGGGSRSLTKVGGSTLTLTAANTYTGTTSVAAGTLALGSSASLASSLISVSSGATFDVSALAAGLSLANGQTLGGRGTVQGATTFANGSFLSFDASGPLAATGSMTFGSGFGIANLTNANWDALTLNSPYTVVATSQVFNAASIGNFGAANRVSVGSTGREAYYQSGPSGDLLLVVVPEPATLGLMTLGGLMGGFSLWKRRRIAAVLSRS